MLNGWSTAAASNANVGAINWAEGMAPAQVNNSARQMMADVALWYRTDGEWIDRGETPVYVGASQFKISGTDVTSTYTIGRRVRLVAPTPGTIYGTVTASVFSTDTTITISWDGTALTNEALTSVAVGIVGNASGKQSLDAKNITRVNQFGMPAGCIVAYGSTAAEPTGFLFCNGQSVSRATYPDLFTAISTFYGAGSTSTFSVPDLRGRVLTCLDALNSTAAGVLPGATTLGGTGGSTGNIATITVGGSIGATTLTANQIPTITSTIAAKNSPANAGTQYGYPGDPLGSNVNLACVTSNNTGGGSHTHSNTITATASEVDAIQPYMSVPYIIKT